MCYIALVKNNPNPLAGQAILEKIADKIEANDDGAFVGSLGVAENLRTLDNKRATQAVKRAGLDNLLVHFRMATTGAITENNVQGWEINGWVCVHNGTVGKLSGGLVEADSDSLKFFKKLAGRLPDNGEVKQIKRAIRKVCYQERFNGRAIIYNRRLDLAVLFGDWYLYEYGGAVVFSSAGIYNLGSKLVKERNGLLFEYAEGLPLGEAEIDGIYTMTDASRDNWKLSKIGELRKLSYNYTYTYNRRDYFKPYKASEPSEPAAPAAPVVEPAAPVGQTIIPLKQAVQKLSDSCRMAETCGLVRGIKTGEIVGYDLGGNPIEADEETGLHLVSGACCQQGICDELWQFIEPSIADNLIKNGVPYCGKILNNPLFY